MSDKHESRIALFIDFENLVTNTGITPSSFDLQPSLDRLLEKGKVVFRRAYCDWSRFREAKAPLHELGVELIDVPPSTRAGKNGADMRLVIDALELCYAREHIDTFVIASGDSDFCPLAYKLRENDRTVIGLAVKDSTSPLFVKACDEFIYLRTGEGGRRRTHDRAPARAAQPQAQAPAAAAAAPQQPAPQQKPASGRQVPDVAREVVSSLLARATGPLNPSLIKETIVRKKPDFDERDHGFSTFSKLLEALEREGLLRRQQASNRQWYVLPPEIVPEAPAQPAAEIATQEPANVAEERRPTDELETQPAESQPADEAPQQERAGAADEPQPGEGEAPIEEEPPAKPSRGRGRRRSASKSAAKSTTGGTASKTRRGARKSGRSKAEGS